eukprot:1160552-Pelagomonas_calceolata.AAC.1
MCGGALVSLGPKVFSTSCCADGGFTGALLASGIVAIMKKVLTTFLGPQTQALCTGWLICFYVFEVCGAFLGIGGQSVAGFLRVPPQNLRHPKSRRGQFPYMPPAHLCLKSGMTDKAAQAAVVSQRMKLRRQQDLRPSAAGKRGCLEFGGCDGASRLETE